MTENKSDNAEAKGGDADVKLFTAFAALAIVGVIATLIFLMSNPPESERDAPPADYTKLQLGDFTFTERSGRLVPRAELDGKILVVGFVFTSCGVDCLIASKTMADVQEKLGEREDVQLVSLTIDPGTDNPEVLKKFAEKYEADRDGWLFLTGDKDEVADTLQSSFLAEDEYEGMVVPVHLPAGRLPLVSRIYLLDREGRIRESFDARKMTTPAAIVAAVETLNQQQPPPADLAERQPDHKAYVARGVIVEIAPDRAKARIKHEKIPGYMMAMTMNLNVRDAAELDGLTPGDEIDFKMAVSDTTHWIHELKPTGKHEQLPGETAKPAVSKPETKPADDSDASPPFPDFEFLSEDGKPVRFSDFEGKALAFTFIFTRCPLPDFCPRMSNRFKETRKLLQDAADGPKNWQFLSLSFDPEHDTPEALKIHAIIHRGKEPAGWTFAVASNETLAKLAPMCDLQFAKGNGTINHNLRTIVLDTKRRVHRVIGGNEWTAEELAKSMTEAAGK